MSALERERGRYRPVSARPRAGFRCSSLGGREPKAGPDFRLTCRHLPEPRRTRPAGCRRPDQAADATARRRRHDHRFADALIWNWLIAGTDAHVKNYSLLLSGDEVRLAPLYDISSALPYGTHERKLRMAMKLGGDYGVVPRRSAWLLAARDLGLGPAELLDRVRELAELCPDAFADAARSPGVTTLRRGMASKLVDLVSERSARCSSAAIGLPQRRS